MPVHSGLVKYQDFLAQPLKDLRTLAPVSVIYSVSGTRRSAALAGISPYGIDYIEWTYHQMMGCLKLLFKYGVNHIIKPVITPSQFKESTPEYRENLWKWLDYGLAGPQAIADYQQLKWRVRLPFGEQIPELIHVAQRLKESTSEHSPYNLWFFVVPEHNILWRWALEHLRKTMIYIPNEAVKSLYGEHISPATMYLDFGKPVLSPDLLPPFLFGKLECYWSQNPGYSLNEEFFRHILYDYAYMRKTWREDKTGRAEQAIKYREAWEEGPIIGLGTRLGPFWYPQSTNIPNMDEEDGGGDESG